MRVQRPRNVRAVLVICDIILSVKYKRYLDLNILIFEWNNSQEYVIQKIVNLTWQFLIFDILKLDHYASKIEWQLF